MEDLLHFFLGAKPDWSSTERRAVFAKLSAIECPGIHQVVRKKPWKNHLVGKIPKKNIGIPLKLGVNRVKAANFEGLPTRSGVSFEV